MSVRIVVSAAMAALYVGALVLLTLRPDVAAVLDSRLEFDEYVLVYSVPTVAFVLVGGIVVGGVVGRWWTPLVLLIPIAAEVLRSGSALMDPAAVGGFTGFLVRPIEWFLVSVWVVEALSVLLGVAARKLVPRLMR